MVVGEVSMHRLFVILDVREGGFRVWLNAYWKLTCEPWKETNAPQPHVTRDP
jgi:hypothetical protein